MSITDITSSEGPGAGAAKPSSPFFALAAYIARAGLGERAALARLNPRDPMPHQLAALSRAAIVAGLEPEFWGPVIWQRWALIAHGMALAGHDGGGSLGEQLARAGVAESRVTKLLTARGDAFTQGLPRILRLMASKGVAPNWGELGRLVLKESSEETHIQQEAEALRLRIAGRYFSAQARSATR
jgi:CRISPR system Cascade subunit CasB